MNFGGDTNIQTLEVYFPLENYFAFIYLFIFEIVNA